MWNFLKDKQCYLVVLGGFLIELSLGSYFSVESIEPFLIKYMNKTSLSKGNANAGNAAWILGLMAFGLGTATSAGGFLAKSIGSSMTVLIGGWIMSLNVALTYYTINTYISVVALSYGLFSGIGAGLSYGVAFGAPCQWFPNNKGLIIGIVLSGFAISSAIFTRIQFAIIEIENGGYLDFLPISFIIVGLCYTVLQLLGALLIKDNPENDVGISTANSLPGIFNNYKCLSSEQLEVKTHQLFLEFDFWILWMTMFINCSSLMVFEHLYVKIGQYYYKDDRSFLLISTIGCICNSLGRVFWGFLIDRKSYKLVMLMITLPLTVLLSTFGALILIHNGDVFLYLYGFWIAVINVFQSGTTVIFPAMCAKLYGMKDFIANYGILSTSSSVSSVIASSIISSYSIKNNATIFINSYIIGGVILFISAGLTFLFRGKSLVFNRV